MQLFGKKTSKSKASTSEEAIFSNGGSDFVAFNLSRGVIMLRRLHAVRLDLHTAGFESRHSKPMTYLLPTVIESPYKDAFKQFWSTPVPWKKREYGPKPKPGDPVPSRAAVTTVVVGHNRHIDASKVASGGDNDYKVLMMFREAKGRYLKDQFVLPSSPVDLSDVDEDWGPVLQRLGVTTPHPDLAKRLAASRALFSWANVLAIPPEGGGLAEVQGPPGPRKWHMMVGSYPSFFRQMLDILELPMETTLQQFHPFRQVETPRNEKFRFNSLSYVVPFDKMPCVKYTISTVGEQLVWVSPIEALERYDAGVMDMPTPNLILLHELARCHPTYQDLKGALRWDNYLDVPQITPEIVHCPATRMGTVLLPGDIHHSKTILASTSPEAAKPISEPKTTGATGSTDTDAPMVRYTLADTPPYPVALDEQGAPVLKHVTSVDAASGDTTITTPSFCRFRFEKDEPWGVRAVFVRRPIVATDVIEDLRPLPVAVVASDVASAEGPTAVPAAMLAEDGGGQATVEEHDAHMAEVVAAGRTRQEEDADLKTFEQTIQQLRREKLQPPAASGEKDQQVSQPARGGGGGDSNGRRTDDDDKK